VTTIVNTRQAGSEPILTSATSTITHDAAREPTHDAATTDRGERGTEVGVEVALSSNRMGVRLPALASGQGVTLALLGGFELRWNGQVMPLMRGAQRLLAFLALHERPLPRAYVAGTLWIDACETRAAGNLRSALWRLHSPRLRLVNQRGDHLQLSSDIVVDVREAGRLAGGLMSGESLDDRSLDIRVLEGELLPGWYDEWILVERERHRQLSLHALELLAERLVSEGRFGLAVHAVLAAIRSEPLRESAHRALLKIHIAEGNASEAIRHYEHYRRLLRQELDLATSEHIDELIRNLRHGGRATAG